MNKNVSGIAITIIVLSALIVGYMIFLHGSNGSNESLPSPPTTPVTSGYIQSFDYALSYGFEYPEDWDIHSPDEFTMSQDVKKVDMFTKKGEGTSITVIAKTTNWKSLDEVKKLFKETYSDTIIEENIIEVNSVRGYEIKRLDSPTKTKMVMFIVNDMVYEFDYLSLEDLYNVSEPVFDHVVNSFRIKVDGQATPTNSQNPLNQKATPINSNQTSTIVLDNVVDANNQFASDLYSKYKSKEGNIFFSPFSVSTALAMTYEGAKGKTAEEMQAVLHLPVDKQKIRSDFVSIYGEINKENKAYMLTNANVLWVQKDYPFISNYYSTVDTYYKGKVTNLDFKTETEKSRVTINNWVENQTYNKIRNIIPPGILTSDTRLVLTNAIYFKANWSNQFDPQNTRDVKFYVNSNVSVNSKMMHQLSYFNYIETSNLQILEMEYLGNDLSMLVILPRENNLNQIENIFNKENLTEWKKYMTGKEVEVTFPKFKFETKYFMANDLAEMGMPAAFKFPDADFTGMSPTGELYIGEVIHQTFVEVTEYGTEASAATVEIMPGAIPEPPKIFNADHPFIFLIQQKSTGNILFIGRLTDPSK